MSYYGNWGDPTTDPRFEVDGKFDEGKGKDGRDGYKDDERMDEIREKDIRNEDLLDRGLDEDRQDKQIRDAYELVRANLSYDDYRQLQADIRGGRVTNQDILNMAKNFKR